MRQVMIAKSQTKENRDGHKKTYADTLLCSIKCNNFQLSDYERNYEENDAENRIRILIDKLKMTIYASGDTQQQLA